MSLLDRVDLDESDDEEPPMFGAEKRPLRAWDDDNSEDEGAGDKENSGKANAKGAGEDQTKDKDKDAVEGEGEVELKKKARKKARVFNEDVITNRDGLLRIYQEFPMSCKFRGRGKETEDLKRLLGLYKEWAFQLHPNLALPDILERCDSLGGRGKVRSHMEQLRDRERCRYLNEVLRVPISEIRMRVLNAASPNAKADMTSPEATSPAFGDDFFGDDEALLESPVGQIPGFDAELLGSGRRLGDYDDGIDLDAIEAIERAANKAKSRAGRDEEGEDEEATFDFASGAKTDLNVDDEDDFFNAFDENEQLPEQVPGQQQQEEEEENEE
jgi:hypothetical protein